MTLDRWQHVKAVLASALELPVEDRPAFVEATCSGDAELRREVESLLASEREIGNFIEQPIVHVRSEAREAVPPGQRIGSYRVLRELGRGGMGSVYLAQRDDPEFSRQAALKIIRRGMDTDEIVRRFREERQILANLDHTNIAKLLDGGTTDDGRPYFIMEHVEGMPIDEYCRSRQLPVAARLALFRAVCSAVHFAHQNLVVHRDLKPGNILVTADGTPKLLDFGIAKMLQAEHPRGTSTELGLRPMTLHYASPEQVIGAPITTASDIYSLGVLLYVLLTDRSPYHASPEDLEGLKLAICEEEPLKPSSAVVRTAEPQDGAPAAALPARPESQPRARRRLRRQLAGDLDNIVGTALRKDPRRRYASVDQFSADVLRYLQGLPVAARRDTLAYRTVKFMRRHKTAAAASMVILALILGFAGTSSVLLRRSERERARAERIATFLEELFAIPNPSRSRGETITAREVLDRGREVIASGLEDQPALRADLMGTMGRVYRSLGLYGPAEELLEESLAVRRRVLGENHLLVAESLHNLALLRREAGDDATAEPLLRRALAMEERQRATRTQIYAKGLNDLAAIEEAKRRYDAAEALYRRSLALKRSLLGSRHEDVARGLNNLARLLHLRGRYEEAKPLYEQALQLRVDLLGKNHPEVTTTLNNLASLLEDRGDAHGAETLYRQVLEIRRKVYGDSHPRVARSLSNLAFVLQVLGRNAEAEPLYREALDIAAERLEPDHPDRAVYLKNLAMVLVALRRPAEAEPLVSEALTIFQTATPTSWRVADAESVLGACLTAQGKFAEAEPLLVGAYEKLKADEGDGIKYAPEAQVRVAELYRAWGRPEEEMTYRSEAPPRIRP